MGAQAGVYSASMLMLHDHLNDNMGGVLNEYSRYGAYRRPYILGAMALHNDNDAEATTANAVYVLIKEITFDRAYVGSVQLRWEMKTSVGAVEAFSRVYRNGVAIGAEEHSLSAAYLPYAHDYTGPFALGDKLQIWAHRSGAEICAIRNFRLCYDWHLPGFGDGTINDLTTALPLSDADLLDVSNTVV